MKTVSKLIFLVITQKQFCESFGAFSVKVVSKPTLRMIAQEQPRGFSHVQSKGNVDTSTNFACECVKPDSLLVPRYARGSTTGGSLPAARVLA